MVHRPFPRELIVDIACWMAEQSPYEIIEHQRGLVARLQSQLAQAQTELAGMEKIFGALPTRRRSPSQAVVVSSRKQDVPKANSQGGRQPGAISMRWRTILNALHRDGKPFTAARVAEVVKEIEDRIMKPSEARRILEGYVDYGYVRKAGWEDFEVTDEAAERFDFRGADDFDALLSDAAPTTDSGESTPAMDPVFPTIPATPKPHGWGQTPPPRGNGEAS